MVLYNFTGYRVLGIVYLNQPTSARHTHISNRNIGLETGLIQSHFISHHSTTSVVRSTFAIYALVGIHVLVGISVFSMP